MAAEEEQEQEESQGSWMPLVVLLVLLLVRWLAYGTSNIPVRFRRFYNMQVRTVSVCWLMWSWGFYFLKCLWYTKSWILFRVVGMKFACCIKPSCCFTLPSSINREFTYEINWDYEMIVPIDQGRLDLGQVNPTSEKDNVAKARKPNHHHQNERLAINCGIHKWY